MGMAMGVPSLGWVLPLSDGEAHVYQHALGRLLGS